MNKKILALLTALLLLLGAQNFALADKLDDVNLCVGGSVRETYYSRGGYICSVKAANPKICEAYTADTMLQISTGFYYGTTVVFTGLSAGSTTLTFYSEYGGWMGSVTVNVKGHQWEKSTLSTFSLPDGSEDDYVLTACTVEKTCRICGEKETEAPELDAAAVTAQPYRKLQGTMQGDDVKALQSRLSDLGYYRGEADGKYFGESDTAKAVKSFMQKLKLETTPYVSPALQEILFSPAAPAFSDPSGKTTCNRFETLSYRSDNSRVKTIQEKLIAFGCLAAGKDTGVYDLDTVLAVTVLQMKLGFKTADGSASPELQALILNGSAEAMTVEKAEYDAITSTIEEALSAIQPKYSVLLTAGSNIRSKPSYESEKLLWVNEGEKLEYLGEENGWYKVAAPDGTTGYVAMDRAKRTEE